MWIRTLAGAAAAVFLGLAVGGVFPAVAEGLFFVAGLATLWTAGLLILPHFRTRDRYDLEELQRVHDEEELRALDDEGALGEPEQVVCGRCLNEYAYRLGACPRCGQSR